jgi:hypothetical protein
LSGAIIVDPPGAAIDDRIFVLGWWLERGPPGSNGRQFAVINGKVSIHQIRLNWRLRAAASPKLNTGASP